MIRNYNQELRDRLGIELPTPTTPRRPWLPLYSQQIRDVKGLGFTIRDVASIMHCSTRIVQDVLQGKRDE